ncbi:hypothetical protein [Streptomyces sp. NPDC001292]|uniref:hypothetical protein n=1 Tax=Streptomyces sp. NPDC001292 TaxID=3364558 RepID=UPI0036B7B8EA
MPPCTMALTWFVENRDRPDISEIRQIARAVLQSRSWGFSSGPGSGGTFRELRFCGSVPVGGVSWTAVSVRAADSSRRSGTPTVDSVH